MTMSPSSLPPFHPYEPPVEDYSRTEYFNPITITYGELADNGIIDWSDPTRWSWDYYDIEQKNRVEKLISGRFWFREISIIPPEAWRIAFLEKLNEAMRVARLMYRILDENEDNIMVTGDEWHKRRTILSDFPATLLNGSGGDYASNGSDDEYETVHSGSFLDAMEKLTTYTDPDLFILDALEGCFSQLVSVNVNGF